jgi:hypothetical protein
MALNPGESATIDSTAFMMHAGMDGPHLFRIYIPTNDPDQPVKTVDRASNWVP